MDNNKKNVPEIRFPGFTEPWEQRKLSEVVTEIKRTDESSDAPVMMITAENGFIYQSERYSSENAGKSLKKYILLKKGELAYNHGASKLRPYGSCFSLTTEEIARIPFVYHCFSTDSENPLFLSIVLNGKAVEKQLRKLVSSGARMDGLLNISYEQYTSIPVLLPEVAEQNRIAELFMNLDNLITLHQRKCEELKLYKKGLLQQMFPQDGESIPRLRFPGFTEPWEQRKFGDIAQRRSETMISDDDNPCIEYEDIITESGLLNKDVYLKSARKNGIRFNASDVLYGKLRPYLHNWLNPDFTGVAVGDWWVLRPVDSDKQFLYRLIQTAQFDDAANQSSGTKMPRADWKLVSSTVFSIPPTKDEQSKIADLFNTLDNIITLHQRECDELKEYKKGLLQKMFV